MRALKIKFRSSAESDSEASTSNRVFKVCLLFGLTSHLVWSILQSNKKSSSWLDMVFWGQGVDNSEELGAAPSLPSIAANSSTDQSSFNSDLQAIKDLLAETSDKKGVGSTNNSTTFGRDDFFQDVHAPLFYESIPLDELVATTPIHNCTNAQDAAGIDKRIAYFPSTIRNISTTHPPGRRIPKIVHVTSKTPCLTAKIKNNLKKWEFEDHSLYFHDDAAVDRLLSKYFPAFPHLQNLLDCTVSGASKADIWRLLVLWEYGGVYTDIDNAPGPNFLNGALIQDSDEAFFVVERIGVLSQYFMAATPRHPFIYTCILVCMSRLVTYVDKITQQYVPYTTGPGVTKHAMMVFMKDLKTEKYAKIKAGTYTGFGGSTLTVVGTRRESNKWIQRDSIRGKSSHYEAMGMQHYSLAKSLDNRDSCYHYLYKQSRTRANETLIR